MLDKNDNTKLFDIANDALFSSTDGYLSSKSAVNGGIVWIHSRSENGKTKVSPQQMMVNNNLLETYTTSEACEAAIESYGGVNKKDYLTPYETEETETVQVP